MWIRTRERVKEDAEMNKERCMLSETAERNLRMAGYLPEHIEQSLQDGDCGGLSAYDTGEYLRDATLEEALDSYEAGIEGVIEVDGRSVYVHP